MAEPSPLPLSDVLRALADAGASNSLLGQVVRELVVSRTVASSSLPAPQFAPSQATPTAPASQATQAAEPAEEAMAAASGATAPPPPDPPFSGHLTMAAEPVVVNFRKNGKRSSVYFTPAKWMELVAEMGDEATTLDLVKQYAAVSPDQGNRSAWVQSAVRASGGMPPRPV